MKLSEIGIAGSRLHLPYSNDLVSNINISEIVVGIGIIGLSLYYATWMSPFAPPFPETLFQGAAVYAFFYPLGFILTIDGISKFATFRGYPFMIRVVILIVFALCCIGACVYFLMETGWDGIAYLTFPESNTLYESLLGFELFFTWIPISIVIILIAGRLFRFRKFYTTEIIDINQQASKFRKNLAPVPYMEFSNSRGGSPKNAIAGPSLKETQPSFRSKLLSYNTIFFLIFMFIILPGLWIACTLLPGDWHHATTSAVISDMQSPSTSQWTFNIEIKSKNNETIYMHVYFDVIIYYVGLFLTFLIGFLSNSNHNIKSLLRRNIFMIPRNGVIPMLYLTIAQALLCTIWLGIFISVFVMFYKYHDFTGLDPGFYLHLEEFSRTSAIMALMFLGLTLIPVTRGNPILTHCFGLSFEGAVKYHKYLGSMMIICGLLHVITMLYNLIHGHYLETVFPSVPWSYHFDNFTLPLMYIIVVLIIIPVFVIGSWISCIRRKFFEIFYFMHIYGSIVLIIGLMFHATNGWYFIIPGVFLQFYERLYRMYKSTNVISIKNLEEYGDGMYSGVTKLVLNINTNYPKTPFGSYYFINIPNINPWEWHPFSVSNPLNQRKTEFYIRNMGFGWTSELYQLASIANTSPSSKLNNINISIEGPYGCNLKYDNYNTIVLIAGGIGITPFHNIFFSLYNEAQNGWKNRIPNVHLLWVVRYAEMFTIYSNTLSMFKEFKAANMQMQLFATRGNDIPRKNSLTSEVTVQSIQRDRNDIPYPYDIGRPNLDHELHFLSNQGQSALVYACGPESLVESAALLANRNGNCFKRETFLL